MPYGSSDDLREALSELSLLQDKIATLQSANVELKTEIDLLKKDALTEEEARLAISSIRYAHTPDSDYDMMASLPHDTCVKLQAIVTRIEKKREDLSSFAATLTAEERTLIEKRRAGRAVGVLLCDL